MELRVPANAQGMRADRFVRGRVALSRADLAALFARGHVRLNGRRIPKGARLQEGDALSVDAESRLEVGARPDASVEVQVVHEDAALLVVDKPAGLPCHPLRPGERGCLANGLLARYPELAQVGYEPRQPGLVHRLDNGTSGLLVVARTSRAFEALRRALAAGQIHKRYHALCQRAPVQHVIDLPLGPDPRDRRKVSARAPVTVGGTPLAWVARTEVLRVQRLHGGVCVEVAAHRAYRHQVRAHLAEAGAPILGDTLYGGKALPCGYHLLHASSVSLVHPLNGRPIEVHSAMPEGWNAQLRRL